MCSRYSLTAKEWDFFSSFLKELMLLKAAARYNIAPTQSAPVIAMSADNAPALRDMRFGFQTPASRDRKASILVNARSETVADKPTFRDAFKERRCLVPATGFYEWRKIGSQKQPNNIRLKSAEPFYFAGLWRTSLIEPKAESGAPPAEPEARDTFVIMTTEPNRLMASIHNRMPVILDREARDRWLDPVTKPDDLHALLRPFDADAMEAWPVGDGVGSPANDSPACLERVEQLRAPVQQDLFGEA
jgi:putative SOS response-associated peptidase YedK